MWWYTDYKLHYYAIVCYNNDAMITQPCLSELSTRCGAVWHGVVRCVALRYVAVLCVAGRCGYGWCGVVQCRPHCAVTFSMVWSSVAAVQALLS